MLWYHFSLHVSCTCFSYSTLQIEVSFWQPLPSVYTAFLSCPPSFFVYSLSSQLSFLYLWPLCTRPLPIIFWFTPSFEMGMGGWQGVCFRAEQQWGCKSSSCLLSSRWCLRRSCLDRTARGPDPLATFTCFAQVPWCLWMNSWGQEGEGSRRGSPQFDWIHWGSLKTAVCLLVTPLPFSSAFSVGCIFKQGRPGVDKPLLSPSFSFNKPNKLAYWVYL